MSRAGIAAAAGSLFLLFLLILLITAPARLLAYWLPGQQFQIQGLAGSLWRGRAASAAIALPGGWLQLGEVKWQLSPWSLLLLSADMELEAEWGQQRLDTGLSLSLAGDIELRETSASFSARLVQQWLPVQLDGQVQLQIPAMEIREGEVLSGAGQLVWQRASWTGISGSQALGDYVVEFEVPATQQLTGSISTLSGPVQANGEISLQGREYSVDVRLESERGFNSEIASALQLLAAPLEHGYHLKFSSEF
jgi:general secretion pathway protein N